MLRSSTKYNAPSALATQVPAARSQNALQHLRIEVRCSLVKQPGESARPGTVGPRSADESVCPTYLLAQGLKVKYVGPGSDDSEAATVRTNYPVPPDCPLYYFEVRRGSEGPRADQHRITRSPSPARSCLGSLHLVCSAGHKAWL